ncbi:YeeE/YedE family protein [Cupriavidus sp. SS-3]|uniref:YeeE/YedE family protein n=1 Tax=Cupriavidus sp. SS-3 TaxID=3109596 RepID=UPI002DBCEABF|nr:YeeE/YedE family protein [Cupriavidus sp. SS-3]MEC3764079.1 YeeE/YedE family protein [Cupriavidus sp. SS-3]
MQIDFQHFTPWLSLAGGLVIGLATALMMLGLGRIAGISGIVGGVLRLPQGDTAWRAAFVIGLLLSPWLAFAFDAMPAARIDAGWTEVLVAGLLVGVGTRYAGGCTSGHGVCGLSRGSVRSLAATVTFMAAGFLTVLVQRHVMGG